MAISVMNWVWGHSRSRHGARLVLLAVADAQRTEKAWAWFSNAGLRKKAALGQRSVQDAVTDLLKLGEIEVEYQTGPGGCNRYRVIMHTPAESAPPPQNPHPAESAPPQDSQGDEFPQASGQTHADSAPPAESAPVRNLPPAPAESAPGTVREPSNPKDLRPKRDLNEGREDAKRLCEHLADRLERNCGERPGYGKTWLDAARLMLDNDKRTEQQVHAAIDWCQDSGFWWKNVMSMPTLREKYLRLRAEAEAERKGKQNGRAPAAAVPEHASPRDEHRYRR